MYDVEHHRYATEFPSTVQVFHFKPESRPLIHEAGARYT